ncbi:Fur family transcriptional regulator [Erythrobacter sp. WG]|uniref:Fur family transcriptional regulator n=1 Tax=Erythrobacter sp. WG TaxID=2985510 RepID=UPI00227148E3|nr:transcriptional repressor [Erythrobacter sp. WG]MCX9147340.1 transcriptional repressor [Erythrobacter sp. WG]
MANLSGYQGVDLEIGEAWEQQRARAAAQFAAHGTCLTPFREAVLREIAGSAQPLGAYEIAARLGSALGKTVAPNSVYRVLDVLMDCAVVRRVESRQAYCLADPAAGAGGVLLMCEGCGAVEAVEASAIEEAVDVQTRAAHFRALRKVMEVTGICQACDETGKGPA